MQKTTNELEVSSFTLHSIDIITSRLTNLIGNTFVMSREGIDNTFNISNFQFTLDRHQMVKDTQKLTITNQTVGSYTVPVLGPQGAVVNVRKYLPSLT